MGPYDKRKGKTMEKIFKLKENGTTVRTEILAGLTTFMTMAYIIALNPNLLTGFAVGTPLWNGVFLATCIASAIGTACMAFLANKPFAMAPGMGLNSFFAVVVANIAVINDCDYTSAFQAALVIILIEGIVFLVLTVLKVREKIVEAIPLGVRYGIAPAIGLMLMNVGLGSNIGIYSENGGPFYMMRDFFGALTPSIIKGNMGSGYDTMVLTVVTAFLGVFVMVVLAKKGIKAAVLLGMLFSSVLYWIGSFAFLGVNPFASLETASFVPPFADMVSTTLFKFDFAGFVNIGWFTAITLIITFCMIDMFDTIGTLVGTASRAGMVNEKGEMPNIFNPEFAGGCLMDINFYNLYLIIALFGGMVSAWMISRYEAEIALFPVTAMFIPVITAMGGNVGIQSSAIVVKGLASNSLSLKHGFQNIVKEIGGALINATICSSIIFLLTLCFGMQTLAMPITVTLSLFVVILFASIFGTAFPLLLNRMKIDPALATGPFITLTNDIIGLNIYLITGRLILTGLG